MASRDTTSIEDTYSEPDTRSETGDLTGTGTSSYSKTSNSNLFPMSAPRSKRTGFLNGDFHDHRSAGYIQLIKLLHYDRLFRGIHPLNKIVAEDLWTLVMNWLFLRWAPINPREKKPKALKNALNQMSTPEALEYWVEWEDRSPDVSEEDLEIFRKGKEELDKYWTGEDFKHITDHLEARAADPIRTNPILTKAEKRALTEAARPLHASRLAASAASVPNNFADTLLASPSTANTLPEHHERATPLAFGARGDLVVRTKKRERDEGVEEGEVQGGDEGGGEKEAKKSTILTKAEKRALTKAARALHASRLAASAASVPNNFADTLLTSPSTANALPEHHERTTPLAIGARGDLVVRTKKRARDESVEEGEVQGGDEGGGEKEAKKSKMA